MVHRPQESMETVGRLHLVRVGVLAQVGRFTSVDAVRYPRGTRVVVRTARGLELGEVLSEPDPHDRGGSDGSILRGVTVEDHLLEARLERNRQAAYDACAAHLAEAHSAAVLVDVEQLFDGSTLAFYFLGEVDPALEALVAELAELYESRAQLRRFAEAVNEGCGPHCGTDEAAGCHSCASGCPVAGACGTRS